MQRHEGILPNVLCHHITPVNVIEGMWMIISDVPRIVYCKSSSGGSKGLKEQEEMYKAVVEHNNIEAFADVSGRDAECEDKKCETNTRLPKALQSYEHERGGDRV